MKNTAEIQRANNIAVMQFKGQDREAKPMQHIKTSTELYHI